MSIRARLILALGMLLASTIIAMIFALLFDARQRVRAEVSSSMRSTEILIRSSLQSIDGASDHNIRLAALVDGLKPLRHVRIYLASTSSTAIKQPDDARSDFLAAAFSVEPGPSVALAVTASGRVIDTLVIEPQRDDEMDEVLDTISRVSVSALAFAVAAFTLTSLLINRALAPIHTLGAAMHAMEDGNYDVGIPQQGPPEIARIGSQLNRLGSALQRSRAENQRLSTAIVRAQDEERRDIARDLHDELGPFLFAIRASGSALAGLLSNQSTDTTTAARLTCDILEHVDALQATNRRVLHQLSPVGLAELGLSGALRANTAMWKRQPQMCQINLDLSGELDALDQTVATTIYRVVQEGLTNALRHAGAEQINVRVHAPSSGIPPDKSSAVTVIIEDDGDGISDETTNGYGLHGMAERVGALGGTLSISRIGVRGTRISAIFPAQLFGSV